MQKYFCKICALLMKKRIFIEKTIFNTVVVCLEKTSMTKLKFYSNRYIETTFIYNQDEYKISCSGLKMIIRNKVLKFVHLVYIVKIFTLILPRTDKLIYSINSKMSVAHLSQPSHQYGSFHEKKIVPSKSKRKPFRQTRLIIEMILTN